VFFWWEYTGSSLGISFPVFEIYNIQSSGLVRLCGVGVLLVAAVTFFS